MSQQPLNRRDFFLTFTGHTRPFITSTGEFFKQSFRPSIPTVSLDTWLLRVIHGLQAHSLTWADLLHAPTIETTRTIASMGNPVGGTYIGNAVWKGVRVRDVLEEVNAPYVKITALDGYETCLPSSQFFHRDTLLVYEMNGQPLSPEHGYPLRLLVGGTYGVKMPKWMSQIEFVEQEMMGFWESRGWSKHAEVQTHAIIFSPRPYEKIRERVMLQGVAFAGYRAITRVEIRIDGGEWIPTRLIQGESPLEWTQWSLAWTPAAPGKYSLEVRATDSAGFTQFEENRPHQHRPNGASAIHQIVVEVI